MSTLSLTFDEVLEGAAGSIEAEAAQRWLDAGAPLYQPPSGLQYLDTGRQGLDMTIHHAQFSTRRRRTSGHGLLASPAKPAQRPAPTKRSAPADSSQQQRMAGPAPAAAQGNIYGRSAFLQHGDAIGLSSRRKGRGPTEFQLPLGWQVHAAGGGRAAGPQQQQAQRPQQQQKQQKPPQQKTQQQQQQQQQQQYMSPEGLVLPSLQAVQDVVQGPVIVPRKLVRWTKAAAANPGAALATLSSTRGLAHLLALRRVRIALIDEERQKLKQRLAAAAGSPAEGTAPRATDRLLRRRS